MSTAPVPPSEERRLAALYEFRILDTPGEGLFDALTRAAAAVCETPMASINLIDRDRIWIKSRVGFDLQDVSRDESVCAHTILQDGVVELRDCAADPRFADSSFVAGAPHIRFYAGVALRTNGGHAIGTFSVADTVPRTLTDGQRASLAAIAQAVLEEFEARRALQRSTEATQERISLLSAAIESAQDPIIIAKPGGTPLDPPTIVYANDAFIRMKGVPREDVIDQPVVKFFGPKTDQDRLVHMRGEVMHGRSARVEYVSYRADGSFYHTEASARPLIDEAGNTTHFVMVQRDVTEQVLRGAQLAMQNERLTAITSIARTLFASLEPTVLVEALLSGVHELVDGRATLFAPRSSRGGFAATTDLALRDDAPAGDPFVGLAARSDVCVLDDQGTRAAVRVPGSGGGTAYVLNVERDTPFSTADVFALGLLGQYFAVAARNVELYQELASRRDAVVELNQVKNDLIAMLAHDFKGPLTTIVGFSDVLAEDERFDTESRQYLGMISSSAMRLASLATDTLALSRLEQNELTIALAEVDLGALVRDVVRVFTVTRPIELRIVGSELTVVGDQARLRQVVENLIGNAIKYSPGGEPVDVALRARANGVELVVRDRGIGIPSGERAKLFGRFARASNARALGIGGTGFGLYLSRTIVELHGGTIDVESVEGQGSTFRVVIPARPVERANAARRIALLDADGDARSYVAHALRDDGYAVTVARTGEELLHQIAERRFDVALVDADRLDVPAEAFVARAGGTPLVRMGVCAPAALDGWDAFLTKPFLMKDLYGAVDAALDRANGRVSTAPAVSAEPS